MVREGTIQNKPHGMAIDPRFLQDELKKCSGQITDLLIGMTRPSRLSTIF